VITLRDLRSALLEEERYQLCVNISIEDGRTEISVARVCRITQYPTPYLAGTDFFGLPF
jgi:hypothetical protein